MRNKKIVLDVDAMTKSLCDLLDLLAKLNVVAASEDGGIYYEDAEHFTYRMIHEVELVLPTSKHKQHHQSK